MAPQYNVQANAKKLLDNLASEDRHHIDNDIKAECEKVQFVGHPTPWMPVPFKFSESSASIGALVAAGAAVIAKDRYGIEQDVVIDT